MKYTPGPILPADLDIAQAPYLGGEFAVYLSRVASTLLGTIEMSASGTGVFGANASAAVSAAGADFLQLVATSELRSPSGPCVVTFNVMNQANTPTTLTFTFNTPSWVANQDTSFPAGYAVDGVLAAGTGIKSVTGLASIVGGERNVEFKLYQLPQAADYALVGCTTEKKFNTKARQPVGIDCGMTADAYVKRGKTAKGELTIDSKFGGLQDRLSRFDGSKCTAMLLGIKDGQITTDRVVFTQFIPGVAITLPDGEGEAMENAATGKYVDLLSFVAP